MLRAGRPRRRAQSWLFVLTFVALGAGTVAGVLYARQQAERSADRRARVAATESATRLEAELDDVTAALAGAGALLHDDGSLDVGAFEGFAADVTGADGLPALALVGVATPDQPTVYPVVVAAAGAAPPAAPIDDELVDAVEAASRSREVRVSGAVDLPGSGQDGVALVRPIVDRDAAGQPLRGFVVAGLPLDHLSDLARGDIDAERGFAVLRQGEVLLGSEIDRRLEITTAALTVPGGRWTVALGPGDPADVRMVWVVGAVGAAAVLAMMALAVTTERHQRALARANALLGRGEERTRAVQEVAGRLARSLTAGEIVAALTAHLPTAVGARSGVIAVLDDTGRLELLTAAGDDVTAEALPGVDDPDSIVGNVVRSGRPAWLRSPLEWRDDPAAVILANGGQALAIIPLAADDITGVVAVSYPNVRIFADDEMGLLLTIAALASRALARGRRYDAEHKTAVAFQRAALPDELPAVDGLTVAARYRPATRRATVGGDWYDVLLLDERRVVLVVGDVVGHGMVAAAAMGRLRTAFQVIARLSNDPGVMLSALGQQVDSIPDAFCTTVVCVVVDLETGAMHWCRAGHPPPVLLRADGAELLDQRGLPPLGLVIDAAPPVHERRLEPGDRLVLYTDGIVERRGEAIDEGFRRLTVVTEDLSDLQPGELSDALVEALVSGEQADDLAVLVVQFEGRPSQGESTPPAGTPVVTAR